MTSASRRAASGKSPAKNDHRLRKQPKKAAAAASKSSWQQLKSLLCCRNAMAAASHVHDPAALTRSASLCSMRDVAVDCASSAASVDHHDTTSLIRSSRRHHRAGAAPSSSTGGGGHPCSLRGLYGCYECGDINVVEPVSRRYPCSQCGEVFTKADSLEQHQAIL